MKKIKEFRMSLMEKDDEFPTKEKGKLNFIIRSSAVLEVEKYMRLQGVKECEDAEYEEFVLKSSQVLYEALMEKNNKPVDSIGVWVKFEDGFEVDNSMDISVLNDIKRYGGDDVKPVQEFFKMTIQEDESEEN